MKTFLEFGHHEWSLLFSFFFFPFSKVVSNVGEIKPFTDHGSLWPVRFSSFPGPGPGWSQSGHPLWSTFPRAWWDSDQGTSFLITSHDSSQHMHEWWTWALLLGQVSLQGLLSRVVGSTEVDCGQHSLIVLWLPWDFRVSVELVSWISNLTPHRDTESIGHLTKQKTVFLGPSWRRYSVTSASPDWFCSPAQAMSHHIDWFPPDVRLAWHGPMSDILGGACLGNWGSGLILEFRPSLMQ